MPCYTEGTECRIRCYYLALTRTINSLAESKYSPHRKLLFIICDGMITGAGNDKPTPRLVLDILGVDPSVQPEPSAYQALGEGTCYFTRFRF